MRNPGEVKGTVCVCHCDDRKDVDEHMEWVKHAGIVAVIVHEFPSNAHDVPVFCLPRLLVRKLATWASVEIGIEAIEHQQSAPRVTVPPTFQRGVDLQMHTQHPISWSSAWHGRMHSSSCFLGGGCWS